MPDSLLGVVVNSFVTPTKSAYGFIVAIPTNDVAPAAVEGKGASGKLVAEGDLPPTVSNHGHAMQDAPPSPKKICEQKTNEDGPGKEDPSGLKESGGEEDLDEDEGSEEEEQSEEDKVGEEECGEEKEGEDESGGTGSGGEEKSEGEDEFGGDDDSSEHEQSEEGSREQEATSQQAPMPSTTILLSASQTEDTDATSESEHEEDEIPEVVQEEDVNSKNASVEVILVGDDSSSEDVGTQHPGKMTPALMLELAKEELGLEPVVGENDVGCLQGVVCPTAMPVLPKNVEAEPSEKKRGRKKAPAT